MKIQAGDVVTLKSDGISMTVEHVEDDSKQYPDNPWCRCVYRLGSELRHDSVRLSALIKAK